MITLFLSALLASVPSTGNITAQTDTVNRYVIDGEHVSNFDGTQLAGKSIASYDIVTSQEKNKVVLNHIIHLVTPANPEAKQENDILDSFFGNDEDHYSDMTKTTTVSDGLVTIKTVGKTKNGGTQTTTVRHQYGNGATVNILPEPSELMLVIDGEKVTKEEFQKLKPSDIKSMTILKGEPAVKLWGPESANGVIEVNTNKK